MSDKNKFTCLTFSFICSFLISIYCIGQPVKKIQGWKVSQYAKDIIKISYYPEKYDCDENISDAVILAKNNKVTIPYIISGQSISIGKETKVNISYTHSENARHGFIIRLHPNEKIYGGGERALPLDRRNYSFNLYNNPWYGYSNGADNLNFSVPFFTSSRGLGLFFDNPSSGIADIAKSSSDSMVVTFVSGELNVYIIFGTTPKKILEGYHKLTGKQGLPPRWALGCYMSRFGYSSENQVNEIVAAMRKENIPFDAVIFDLFWFGDSIKGTMGNLEWVNKSKWPDPPLMLSVLKKQNIKSILITEPFILQSSLNYARSLPYQAVDSLRKPYILKDFYFGLGGLVDIFKKESRKWFWEKHNAQIKIGVDAWWGDLGEPEKHPVDLYHDLADMGHKRLFRSDEVHNIYGHLWTKMLYENYAREYPDARLFSLNRSGFAGSQRYNIFPWSGDVSRSWSGLQAQLPVMLGMSMSGIPYIHSDAGGFAGGEGDFELYVRWLQFSAFTPIFRPHGTALFDLDPSAYSFPSEPALMPDPYLSMVRKTVQTRYKMLPYNYTLAYNHTKTGQPLVAPLYYYFPDDTLAIKIEDQFMWGPGILVAPVLHKNQKTRQVYFPDGKWFLNDFDHNDAAVSYSGTATLETPLEKTLTFAKAGSFIPIIDKVGYTSEDYKTDSLTVHYFYNKNGSVYTLFDDDGVNKNSLKNKDFELLTFRAAPKADVLALSIDSNKGKYPVKKGVKNIKIVIHGDQHFTEGRIIVNNKSKKLNFSSKNEVNFNFNGSRSQLFLYPK